VLPLTSSPMTLTLTAFRHPHICGFDCSGTSLELSILEAPGPEAMPHSLDGLSRRRNRVSEPAGIASEESMESVETAGLHPRSGKFQKPSCQDVIDAKGS